MADRHREIGKRQQERQRIIDARAQDRKYHADCVERRLRRLATFLLSDALDLVDEIPVPGALEKSGEAGYRASMEGAEYHVNTDTGVIRFRTDEKGIWDGSLRNKELGPINVEWDQGGEGG